MKYLICFIVLISLNSFSQKIEGIVFNKETNLVLPSVSIHLLNMDEGVSTNNLGEFKLRVRKKDVLVFSHIGYKTQQISIADLKENNFKVYLELEVQNLSTVSVSSKRNLRNRLRYTKLTSFNKKIYSFGSTLVDGKIHLFGGNKSNEADEFRRILSTGKYDNNPNITIFEILNNVGFDYSYRGFSGQSRIYNLEKDSWSYSNMEFREKANCEAHYYEDKIYVIGGRRLSKNKSREYLEDKIEVYDLVRDSVFLDDVNPHQAVNFASVIKDENLIIIGGSTRMSKNGVKTFSNQVHLYNLKTGLWFELDGMPTAKESKGILVKNKIYLIGGNNGKAMSTIESLDLISGKWKIEGKAFKEINRPAIAHFNNIIYVYENGEVLTLDINTNELNQYAIGLYLKKSNMHFYNNKLYILGGYLQDEFSITPSQNVYSIDLEEFSKTRINNFKILNRN